jgi:hypothetical protein
MKSTLTSFGPTIHSSGRLPAPLNSHVGRLRTVNTIAIQIERFVDDHQPGFVECRLVDALGRSHLFIEKIPVVTTANIWSDSSYPQVGVIACEIESESIDGEGRTLSYVNTERPWTVESTEGVTRFVVLSSQVVRQ